MTRRGHTQPLPLTYTLCLLVTHVKSLAVVFHPSGKLVAQISPAGRRLWTTRRAEMNRTGWFCLSFADSELEARYQRWHRHNYQQSLHMRLLIATFMYFVLAMGFTAWAHEHSTISKDWPHLLTITDTSMGIILSMCFAFSFMPCTARRPQIFSSIVLLVTISFVVLRSTFLDVAAVYSAPVLLVLIVCILLGTTLLRTPCLSTLLVGCLATGMYGTVALLELRRAPDGANWEPVALFMVVGSSTLAAGQLERLQRHLFLAQVYGARAGRGGAALLAPMEERASGDAITTSSRDLYPPLRPVTNADLLNPLLTPAQAEARAQGEAASGPSSGPSCLNADLLPHDLNILNTAPFSPSSPSGLEHAPSGLGPRVDSFRSAMRDLVSQLGTQLNGTASATEVTSAVSIA